MLARKISPLSQHGMRNIIYSPSSLPPHSLNDTEIAAQSQEKTTPLQSRRRASPNFLA